MFQLKIVIFFFFGFTSIFLVETADQETLPGDLFISDERAAASIREIQPNEVLPIILFMNPRDFKLYVPTDVEKIQTNSGRIANGSKFLREDFKDQIYFCPRENSEEKCLAPRIFDELEPLECTKQAIPIVRKVPDGSNHCGIENSGILHEVVYEICPAQEPYKYQSTDLKIYEICYDSNRKIILYAHYTIRSEKLLDSKLLFRERDLEYEMMTDVILPLSNYEELLEASRKENKSPYKLQKLVPSEDMAFALWRKSTYQFINVALQHQSLIPLWNHFRLYYPYNVLENSIYDGVLYKQSSDGDGTSDQNPEIWFKVICTEASAPRQSGIVILTNNFLIPKTTQSTPLNPKENTLKKYCEKSICTEGFIKEFEQIGSRVHCCRWDTIIANLLGIPYY